MRLHRGDPLRRQNGLSGDLKYLGETRAGDHGRIRSTYPVGRPSLVGPNPRQSRAARDRRAREQLAGLRAGYCPGHRLDVSDLRPRPPREVIVRHILMRPLRHGPYVGVRPWLGIPPAPPPMTVDEWWMLKQAGLVE